MAEISDNIKNNAGDVGVVKAGLEQELYKKNVELDFANQIFSLTRELYSIGLLNLGPATFAEKVTSVIREKLQLEFAGVLSFKQKEDLLEPLAFSKSERTVSTLRKVGFLFRDIKIPKVSKHPTLANLFDGKVMITEKLSDVWGGLVREEDLELIKKSSNIKNVLVYPLLTEEKFVGVLVFGIHLTYNELPEIEREAIRSFADIVAIVLDKAYIYHKLDEVNQGLISANIELLKANEELKTLDETKSAILSGTSHHLQNPLQDIVMGTSMLLDGSFGEVPPEAKKTVAKIFESARHLTITLKMWLKTLDFENNKVEYKKENFDLAVLADKTIEGWRNSAKERGIEISLETDDHSPYTIYGDAEWIREVLVNLIDNAFKMTEKGFIKLKIEKVGAEKIQFSIKDSGVGMSEDTKKNLFQKFGKGKEGWKKDIYGTGLGLYLCKKIIEEGHHGQIYAESEGENKGSTFFVNLNLA